MAIKCLNKQSTEDFLKALKEGKINPDQMVELTSDQRRDFLAQFVGKENAKFVNTQFESKLLLKNQKLGMVNWAKSVAGLNERTKTDIIKKIEKLDRALNPREQEFFLSDIVERRLGIGVSEEEANKIIELTNSTREVRDQRFDSHENLMEYNRRLKKLNDYLRTRTPLYAPDADMFTKIRKGGAELLSIQRAIKVGLDLSASFRQGFAMFGTKQWNGAFFRMFRYASDQTAFDELEVEMMSHKYAEQLMQVKRELGLTMFGETFTQREEQFASKFIDSLPGLNNAARAYEGFLNDLRFNRFVDYMEQLDLAGNGISEDIVAMKNLAKVIGAATGRGTLGSLEGASRAMVTVLFSPRYLAARLQLLINPFRPSITGVARKEAAKSLARTIGLSAALLGLAKLGGADVEDDTRSSDVGKMKIGNSRFDLTGGTAQYIVAFTRAATGKSKSPTTGKVLDLDSGDFGAATRATIIKQFISNKSSPLGRVILDAMSGKSFEGETVFRGENLLDAFTNRETVEYLTESLLVPLIADDAIEAYQESANNKIALAGASIVASIFGFGVTSFQYRPRGKRWDQLRDQVGEERYEAAINNAQIGFADRMARLEKDSRFINAPEFGDNSQADMIDKARSDVEKRVLSRFGFRKPRKKR